VGAVGEFTSGLSEIAKCPRAAAQCTNPRLWRIQPRAVVFPCAGLIKRDSADEYRAQSIILNRMYKLSLAPKDRIVDRPKIPYHINGYDKAKQAPK
jgi:hypothetical protein